MLVALRPAVGLETATVVPSRMSSAARPDGPASADTAAKSAGSAARVARFDMLFPVNMLARRRGPGAIFAWNIAFAVGRPPGPCDEGHAPHFARCVSRHAGAGGAGSTAGNAPYCADSRGENGLRPFR